MIQTKEFPDCGSPERSDELQCPCQGAEDEMPKTIEALKVYCENRSMPLSRMRFFIGENYEKPKAFGIYEDGGRYIVYKNKANGERATRYSGPDETYAVEELFRKLLGECHKRGIYPDGRPEEAVPRSTAGTAGGVSRTGKQMSRKKIAALIVLALCVIILICIFSTFDWSFRTYENGYYKLNNSYYLKKGSYWFFGGSSDWYSRNGSPSESVVYLGHDYDPEWGVIEFEQSETGKNYQTGQHSDSNTYPNYDYSSSDYSSWDSGDTDWNSDW